MTDSHNFLNLKVVTKKGVQQKGNGSSRDGKNVRPGPAPAQRPGPGPTARHGPARAGPGREWKLESGPAGPIFREKVFFLSGIGQLVLQKISPGPNSF